MIRFPAIALLFLLAAMAPAIVSAQEQPNLVLETLHDILPSAPVGSWESDLLSQISRGTNGVFISYGDTTLSADNVTVNQQTGEANADGNVRIEQAGQLWLG